MASAEVRQTRAFGRGAILPASSPARSRVYCPRGERVPSAAKSMIAAVRRRDARGHFLPSAGGPDRAAVPVALAALVGDADTLLADLAALSGAVRPARVGGAGDTGVVDLVVQNGAETA
jgi:hypothetical protein